jgi:tRNA (adenine57-N1/adenine58-N1)-methyltransferase catalytic subunit
MPFGPGEKILLIDQRDRTYLFTLQSKGTFHTHSGTLGHEELLGKPEGTKVETSKGMVFVAFRPRFADFVLKMPRGAQVVYPKDLGPIVTYADVYPGARVLEAGTGSGALTIALCRAVGDAGVVVSYELRAEHREQAVRNIEAFYGEIPRTLELREGDLSLVGETTERYDRAVLDLPEPWGPLRALAKVLEPGAVVCAYLPTTIQIQQLVLALPGAGFQHVETFETLKRGWHVTERSVRPDHRMVGHTGFLTIARLATPAS